MCRSQLMGIPRPANCAAKLRKKFLMSALRQVVFHRRTHKQEKLRIFMVCKKSSAPFFTSVVSRGLKSRTF